MFKKALALLLLLFMFSNAFAIRLIEPESKVLEGDDLVGKIYPGGTLELIFSKENNKYSAIQLKTALPSGYSSKIVNELESFKLFISVPVTEANWKNSISIDFVRSGPAQSAERADMYFLVENDLLAVSMNGFSRSAYAGASTAFEFVLVNKSDAEATFSISSTLPREWSSGATIIIPKKSTRIEKVSVSVPVQGKRQFDFEADYSNKVSKFRSSVEGIPTFLSKFRSAVYGIPFYSFSMIPSYLLDGILALFF